MGRLTIILCILLFLELSTEAMQYQFKRYPFRKKKDDKVYRNKRVHCDEIKGVCRGLSGVQQTKCLRQCMSQHCYDEIYGNDELEEGEIDVRLNSYKGCLAQNK